MKFVSSPDVSQNTSSPLDGRSKMFHLIHFSFNIYSEKPTDMNGYYSWLHFLKTSTSTQENHVNVSSKNT
jgi:hypothetical protein